MLPRILKKALLNRRASLAVGCSAVFFGAALVSALASLYLGLSPQAEKELRAYGANLLVLPEAASVEVGLGALGFGAASQTAYLSQGAVPAIEQSKEVVAYAPYLHGTLDSGGVRVALAGTKFEEALAVSPWWQVTGQMPANSAEVLLGSNAARRLGLGPADSLTVTRPQPRSWRVAGIVETGGPEDEQVLVRLDAAQDLLGKSGLVDTVQVSALGDRTELENLRQRIESTIPGARVQIVGQVAEAQAAVMDKVQMLMGLVAALVLVVSGMAVASTMTTTVVERSKEIGLMRAIGAPAGRIALVFLAEAAIIGLIGGTLGYAGGLLIAGAVAASVFGATLAFQALALPVTLGIALTMTLLASALPVRRALALDPAITLRGE
ncbi:MAG: ABC transporter permease [Chloroflexi bacterium]|nr:ABC transporter permease [Chloroflexota bacterium]